MNVKNFIKVTVIASGSSSVVPASNKSHYEQANDLEKKAKKSPLYKISDATEEEIVKYYPELASGKIAKVISVDEHKKLLSDKDKEIEASNKLLENKDKEIEASNKLLENKDKEIEVLKKQLEKPNQK